LAKKRKSSCKDRQCWGQKTRKLGELGKDVMLARRGCGSGEAGYSFLCLLLNGLEKLVRKGKPCSFQEITEGRRSVYEDQNNAKYGGEERGRGPLSL